MENDIFGQAQAEPQGEPVVEPQGEHQAATPPVAEEVKQVPLQALEAERSKRREWRDKFHQLQGELDAERRMRQSATPAAPAQKADPAQFAIEHAENSRLNTSELLAREKFGDEAVDSAFKRLQDANDQSVFQRIMREKHPWAAVVKEAKRMEMMETMGDDPMKYEENLRAKWLADQNGQGQAPAPKPALPQSIATARSSAARTAPGFTGPPSMNELFG